MHQFLKKIPKKDKELYSQIGVIASLPTPQLPTQPPSYFQICRHSLPFSLPPKYIDALFDLRTPEGCTCLHISATYGNVEMTKYLVQKNIVNPNTVNNMKENALIYSLKNSQENNFAETMLFLMKYTDLTVTDAEGMYAHQVPLILYNQLRARVVEQIKEQYLKSH